ncbi:hypothetical protein F5882DRAFT_464552 [Hyaloscypha sp. PMI_1271]|nr:hypothetical protein F5882DRAFT_464552 [Hyaloscypha sp. PMI_1271]
MSIIPGAESPLGECKLQYYLPHNYVAFTELAKRGASLRSDTWCEIRLKSKLLISPEEKKTLVQVTFAQGPLSENGIGIGTLQYLKSVQIIPSEF